MSAKVYVIADTHFGHGNILKFSPERGDFKNIYEHDQYLIDQWNSVVTKRDTVWHLGDVVLGPSYVYKKVLPQLAGYKRLVMGNHDKYKQLRPYFDVFYGVGSYKRYILSHIPVTDEQKYRYRGNIHGHMHAKSMDDPWYKCVSVEHTDMKPILIDRVIDEMRE